MSKTKREDAEAAAMVIRVPAALAEEFRDFARKHKLVTAVTSEDDAAKSLVKASMRIGLAQPARLLQEAAKP